MTWLWRFFPVFYTLPFVAATLSIERVAAVGDIARWLVLGIGALLAVFAAFERGRRAFDGFAKSDLAVIGFLAFFLLSSRWSIEPLYTLQRTISVVLLCLTCFWVLWRWVNQFSTDLLIAEMLYTLGTCLLVNLGLGLVFARDQLLSARFQGAFENPNNIGLITALCVPLALGRALLKRRIVDWSVLAVFLANMVLCGSRTAMVSAFMAAALMILAWMIRRAKLALTLTGLLAGGMLALSQTAYFKENVLREKSLESMSNRSLFWELATTEYIPHRPRLGHGFGSDRFIHDHYGTVLSDLQLRGYGVMSSYYGLAVQVGIPATVLFFGLLWGGSIRALLRFRRDWQSVMFAATVVSGLLACVAESAIYSAGNCFAFLFWAVVMLMIRRGRELDMAAAVGQAIAKQERRKQRIGLNRPTPRPRRPMPAAASESAAEVSHANSPLHGQA
jgi:hypothetical protein